MATGLCHSLLCLCSHKKTLIPAIPSIKIPNSITRFRIIPKSSPQKNLRPNSVTESKPRSPRNEPESNLEGGSSFAGSISRLLCRIRDEWKVDNLGPEIVSIALPAALALAADPITSLVDTAFVGHLGSAELAAVGVSISVFNLVSKLFNVPLLNITTSFVAEEQALISDDNSESLKVETRNNNVGSSFMLQESTGDKQRKKLLPAVSASLVLAAGIGIAEAIALSVGSGFLMNIMGIPVVRQA